MNPEVGTELVHFSDIEKFQTFTGRERNAMRKIGTRLIKAAETRAIARGDISDGFVVHVPDGIDVTGLRKKLRCSQSEFYRRFGFAIGAVQDWQQHRWTSDRTARIFQTAIEPEREAVRRALARVRHFR